MMRSSLTASITAPMEKAFTWTTKVPVVLADGRYSPEAFVTQTLYAAMIANRRVWPSRAGYGKWETTEAPLVAIRGSWDDGQCTFPAIQPGDTLTDAAGRVWEVLLREEWEQVGLLVLTVRAVEGASKGDL